MNKKITAVFFTAVLSLSICLISQAEEQPVINDEACSSGSAVDVCFDELPPEDEPESVFEEASESSTDITAEDNEDADISAGLLASVRKPKKPLPADIEEITEEDFSGQEPSDPSEINSPSLHSASPENGSSEDNKNSRLNNGEILPEAEADSEEEPPLPDTDSDEITKAQQNTILPSPKRSSSGSGSGLSGRKNSDSRSAAETAEITEAENITADVENTSQNSRVYTGEELTEKANLKNGVITFEKNGTELEIPSDFIENNNIEENDIVSVSINRNENTVDVSVKINDEDVNEIEGAKIIVPDDNGKINILPADSLGEFYISGSYNGALWPLGSAFPFVVALAYIFLMGGAAAAVWKKIRSM